MLTKKPGAIAAVVVTLNPGPQAFAALLRSIAPQVSWTVIVDNSSINEKVASVLHEHRSGPYALITKGCNIGLAGAQNEGIARAMHEGAQYILLLDQDSVPMPDMVEHLIAALNPNDRREAMYAAAGPVYIDALTQRESHFVQIGILGFKRVRCDGAASGIVPADALIASGTLIPTDVLRDVGLMDESLFIDHVDTEWCMRARAKGYRMLGVCAARMSHRLGETPSRAVAGRQFFVRNPTRHYYIFRNSVLLYRRPYVPLGWCIGDAAKLLVMFALIAVSCTPRMQHIGAMIDGIADGVRGRSGPRP